MTAAVYGCERAVPRPGTKSDDRNRRSQRCWVNSTMEEYSAGVVVSGVGANGVGANGVGANGVGASGVALTVVIVLTALAAQCPREEL